jgi:hypothetical protein
VLSYIKAGFGWDTSSLPALSCQWQDRQCTHNVTMGRGRARIVAVEEQVWQIVSVCVALVIQHAMRMAIVSSLAWPAHKYFSTLPHKGTIFEKKNWKPNCHSEKNWETNDKKCVVVFRYSTRYSCPILMNPELPRQILEK